MVNKDPGKISEDALPEIEEPVARETYDNLLVGVYSITDGGWTLQVRDWANRVVEATVYKDVNEPCIEGGVEYRALDAPEDMDPEAYLKELLKKRVDALEEEESEALESKN